MTGATSQIAQPSDLTVTAGDAAAKIGTSATDVPLHEQAVDATALARAMRARGIAVAGQCVLRRIGHGQSNITYAATDSRDGRWIVRRPPLGELLPSAHDVTREFRVLSALGPTAVPTPAQHALLPAGEGADVPVAVMEHVDGQVVDGFDAMPLLAPPVRRTFARDLATVLAAIHAVDLVETGLTGLGSHSPYAARQLRRWSGQVQDADTPGRREFADTTELLRRHVPPPSEPALIHGDFSPRNVVMDPGSGKIRAVLDWELSTLGDPLADVGIVLAYWTADTRGAADIRTGSHGGEARAAFLAQYTSTSGRDRTHIAYWHALALWRLAAITAGVIKRAADEPRNAGAKPLPVPSDVVRLLESADGVARAAGLN